MKKQKRITNELLQAYQAHLVQRECAHATIQKYLREVRRLSKTVQEASMIIDKSHVLNFKTQQMESRKAAGVNGTIAALNSFFRFCGWTECVMHSIKIQHRVYEDEKRELTKDEYYRLLSAAKKQNNHRLYELLQTICSTGIRVSELRYITVEVIKNGIAQVRNKGKTRIVFLPMQLCSSLEKYCTKHGILHGPIFITRSGRPLDRSNIWTMMKSICKMAGVTSLKVYPHNLRHLFARIFYKQQHDLEHLACILGHSNINTTRIYTRTSGTEHRRQIEELHLII